MDSFKEKDWVIVSIPPKFTLQPAVEFSTLCNKNVQEGNTKFIIDASALTVIDSYAVGILVKSLSEIRGVGGDIRIRNLKGDPLNIFRQTELTDLFIIENDEGTPQTPGDFSTAKPGPSELRVYSEAQDGTIILKLSGNMRYPDGTRKLKENALIAMADKNRLLLDMEELEFMDSKCAGEIVILSMLLKTTDGTVRICGANEFTKDILTTLNINKLVPMYNTVEAALKDW